MSEGFWKKLRNMGGMPDSTGRRPERQLPVSITATRGIVERSIEGVKEPYDYAKRILAVRHADAERTQPNKDRKLSDVGIDQSEARSMSVPNPGSIVAVGSPRPRTTETNKGIIRGANDTEDAPVSENVHYRTDWRLDFYDDESVPVEKKLMEIYGANLAGITEPAYLKWIVTESDAYAAEHGGSDRMTYSNTAARVASVFLDLIKAPVSDDERAAFKKGHEPVVDMFACTHGGILETFMAKVIEKTEGVKRRDAFIASLNPDGFENVQGLEIDVQYHDGKPRMFVNFQSNTKRDELMPDGKRIERSVFDFNAELTMDVLMRIIDEGGGYVPESARQDS